MSTRLRPPYIFLIFGAVTACFVAALMLTPAGSPSALGASAQTTPNGISAAEASPTSVATGLTITQFAPSSVIAGAHLTYRITIDNTGPGAAANVKVRDALPAGLSFVSVETSQGSCTTPAVGARGTLACATPVLDVDNGSGAPWTIVLTVQVTARAGTTLRNTVSTTASGGLAAVTATARTTVVQGAPDNTATPTETLAAESGTATLTPSETGAPETGTATETPTGTPIEADSTPGSTETPTVTRTPVASATATLTGTPTRAPLRLLPSTNTYTVNSTGDQSDGDSTDGICDTGFGPESFTGICTLRAAIEQANADGVETIVNFDLNLEGCDTNGVCTISLGSPPDAITVPVTIDGSTSSVSGDPQPQCAQDGHPCIDMDGGRISGGGFAPVRKPAGPNSPLAGMNCLTVSGGNSTVQGLVVNNCPDNGIELNTLGGDTIRNNYIGTDVTGATAAPNGANGIYVNGVMSNTIGGITTADRNVISGNTLDGILIDGSGATGNKVEGNYIGVVAAGDDGLGNNLDGVGLAGSSGNTIGGSTAGARNIISGNSNQGVSINCGSTDNTVEGNYIGTDSTGANPVGNGGDGVRLDAASDNTIGPGNVISANGASDFGYGVNIGAFSCESTSSGNSIVGNLIGTTEDGLAAMGNASGGVNLGRFSTGNTVGGTSSAERNEISGNNGDGVQAFRSSGNVLEGNYIGTDITGNAALPNSFDGVSVVLGSLTIGGSAAGAGNVISGNDWTGVNLLCSDGTVAQGNFIGIGADMATPLGNGDDGVRIGVFCEGAPIGRNPSRQPGLMLPSTYSNLIGGEGAGEGNVIAHNSGNGVTVGVSPGEPATGNAILGNSIFSNTPTEGSAGLGIDLAKDGVTLDDSSGHSGPNLFQNFPVLTSAKSDGTIEGSLKSAAASTFTLEFFSNDTCDPSRYGEGQIFLGAKVVTTDGSGNVDFTASVATFPAGKSITATAIDDSGNTSEFSACILGEEGPTKTPTSTRTSTRTRTRTPTATNTSKPGGGGGGGGGPPAPSATNTEELTATGAPTLVPTDTGTAGPTATETETPLPTETVTPVPTLTLLPTLTGLPTFTTVPSLTPTPTATSLAGTGILINEFRTRGPTGTTDEFVELVNSTEVSIDVSGWKIEISDGSGSVITLLMIAPNTILQPGQHLLLANNSGAAYLMPLGAAGSVGMPFIAPHLQRGNYSGLVTPDQTYKGDIADDGGIAVSLADGTVVDEVGMSVGSRFKRGAVLAPLTGSGDRSYHRKSGDASGTCVNTGSNAVDYAVTPSQPANMASPRNRCTVAAVPVFVPPGGAGAGMLDLGFGIANFRSPYFVDSIKGPQSLLAASITTLLTNLLLAIILAILFGFFGLLLYDTLEAHEQDVRGWLGPLNRLSRAGSGFEERLGSVLGSRGLAWLGDIIKILIALLVFGLVYALLDPNLSFDHPGVFALVIAVALAIGLVNLFDDIAKLLYVRRQGARASVVVHSGNLVIGGLMVLVSRAASLSPGILSVGPGGLEGEEKGDPLAVSVIGALGYAIPAIVAWLVLLGLPAQGLAGPDLWIATVLSLIFAIGLQSVFFEMIPIPGLYGRVIFQRHKVLWVTMFALFTFLFLQTQLNPEGSFVSSFNKPNMMGLGVFVLAFCAFSTGTWLFFQVRDRQKRESAR